MPTVDLITDPGYRGFCMGTSGLGRFPVYDRLRTEDPVHWSEILNSWVITRYDDVHAGFVDERLSANRIPVIMSQVPEDMRERVQPLENHFRKWMGMNDPPEHTKLRNRITPSFAPKVIGLMKDPIQSIVDGLLDAVEPQGRMDLMNDFAFKLTATVICDMLGIPREDQNRFRSQSEDIMKFLGGSPATMAQSIEQSQKGLMELVPYFKSLINERRQTPRDDLISRFVQLEKTGDGFNDEDLVAMCIFLFFAGHETTMNLVGNGFLAMFQNPAEMEKLKQDPALLPSAVEEFLRYYSSLQRQVRYVKEDLEIRGREIHKGQGIMLMQGAANRDSAEFTDPNRLDITRKPNRHLAFSVGTHFCLGAPLARLEGRIAFGTVLERFPEIRLECPVEELEWHPTMTFLSMKSMPVALR
jgi:cytochrome P450